MEKGAKKTIGILGGGQLAKMLCESGKNMGYGTIVLDPSEDACSRLSADIHLCGEYTDEKLLKSLAEKSDVITYEFENVPSEAIDKLIEYGGNIPQGKRPLFISQHRIREKNSIGQLGIQTADYMEIESPQDLKDKISTFGYPAILKTCTGGYDGKGQWKLQEERDLNGLNLGSGEFILEKMIDFQCEVSCIAVRSVTKEVVTIPVGENIHKNGILHLTIVPPRVERNILERVERTAKEIIEGLDFVGPLAIEFFVGKDGEIYVNEIAPRPHNSGHYSMDGCNLSQFDLHIRSLMGEKMEKVKLNTPTVMLNILGEDREFLERYSCDSQTKVHIYGKRDWKKGRKMGHINFMGKDIDSLLEKVNLFYLEGK